MISEEKRLAKIEANKVLIGREIYINLDGGYHAIVKDVIDEENVMVTKNGLEEKVSIFDIR